MGEQVHIAKDEAEIAGANFGGGAQHEIALGIDPALSGIQQSVGIFRRQAPDQFEVAGGIYQVEENAFLSLVRLAVETEEEGRATRERFHFRPERGRELFRVG